MLDKRELNVGIGGLLGNGFGVYRADVDDRSSQGLRDIGPKALMHHRGIQADRLGEVGSCRPRDPPGDSTYTIPGIGLLCNSMAFQLPFRPVFTAERSSVSRGKSGYGDLDPHLTRVRAETPCR